MARLFSILCFNWALALTLPALGQQAAPTASAPIIQHEYVTLIAVNGGNAILDYGQSRQEENLQLKQPPITELQVDAATVRKLGGAMPALNYLSSRGWEYVGMSSRQQSTGSTTSGSFSIYSPTEYLLRRRKY